jgi:hypothetical protein
MLLLLALLHLVIPEVHAATLDHAGSSNPAIAGMWASICSTLPFCGVGADAPRLFACKLARFIFGSISGAAVCVVIYGGLRLVTSQGDESGVSDAKQIIAYAAGGLALAMIAFAAVPFAAVVVSSAFGGGAASVVPLQCM